MELKLKTISKDGIVEALSKVELYRYLNEPEEAESICHDVLAADPENQLALRMLALTITDQFEGQSSDRYAEAEQIFQSRAGPPEHLLGRSFRGASACSEWRGRIYPGYPAVAVVRYSHSLHRVLLS